MISYLLNNMQPLNRHILIKTEKPPETTSYGFIIKVDDNAILEKGTVLAVDPAVEIVKEGDEVFYKAYSLSKVEIDGKEYAFLKEDEVLGKE